MILIPRCMTEPARTGRLKHFRLRQRRRDHDVGGVPYLVRHMCVSDSLRPATSMSSRLQEIESAR